MPAHPAPYRPCPKPEGHPHGTARAFYAGCRCQDSRDAYNALRRKQYRLLTYGRRVPDEFVDAAPTRDKLAVMRAAGMSNEQIGGHVGLAATTVAIILSDNARPTVRASTARTVAAAPLPRITRAEAGRDGYLLTIGTARRLRALTANGWSLKAMSEETGMHRGTLQALRLAERTRVQRDVAARVAEAYDRLWNATPPARNSHERGAITVARKHAAAQGWLPPMAWDDGMIDDPDYTPDVTVLRRNDDDPAARLESFIELLDQGLSLNAAALRAGYNHHDTAARALLRHGRSTLEWPQNRPENRPSTAA